MQSITIGLPYTLNTGDNQMLNYYVPSSTEFKSKFVAGASANDAEDPGISGGTLHTASKATSNQFSVTYAVETPVTISASNFYIGLSFMNVDRTDTAQDDIVAPFAAKNKATRYESWMIIAKTGAVTYVQTH